MYIQEKKAISLSVKKWQDRKESSGEVDNDDDDDIYAVHDDESDDDVTMVIDASSGSQETSLVAHVSGRYPWYQ